MVENLTPYRRFANYRSEIDTRPLHLKLSILLFRATLRDGSEHVDRLDR